MTDTSRQSLHVRITGQVQGVWYRAWTRQTAEAKGLSGWVRNCTDGAVEAVFSGPPDKVESMIAACRTGPERARVDGVATEPCKHPAETGFEIRPDR